ncbi:MAG: right-handed parallel beta-helix repeat-containing protein [Candidatus Thermoplasmatota archaeon]|nr:right-handed parallel beta-helix repeat-containing protein [Candidatus Thermoplasmatota archaeon]
MAIIDRELHLDGLRKKCKRSSKAFVFAMILIAALVLGATAGLIGQIGNSNEPIPSETPMRIPAKIAYTTHSPISINGNAGFTNDSGVVWGSGTASDPYVIGGWEIGSFPANGIEIRDADVHFVIRDCYVHDSVGWESAISLSSCSNGTVSNCTCTSPFFTFVYGIYLSSSDNSRVVNCTSSGSLFGIYLVESDGVALANCTCLNNQEDITLESCAGVSVVRSICSVISLGSCVNVALSQNELSGEVSLWGDVREHFNTHSIDTTNTIHGLPVYYFKNQTGISVPSGGGQMLLANCSDTSMIGQTMSDDFVGILIAYCSGINLSGNTFPVGGAYIHLLYSGSSSVVGNYLSPSSVCVESSNDINLTDNTVSDGSDLSLYSSNNCCLVNNTCTNNEYGIRIHYSEGVMLTNNNCSSNIFTGIDLEFCTDFNITDNRCMMNGEYGIMFDDCINLTLRGNELAGSGIFIGGYVDLGWFTTHTIDPSNTVNGRPVYYYADQAGIAVPYGAGQVLMANCAEMQITGQNLSDASVGMELVYCSEIVALDNICSGNEYGILLSDSSGCFTGNDCSHCSYGILLAESANSTLSGNTCSFDERDGIWLIASDDNTLIGNNCSSNGEIGIDIYYSSRNSLAGNNCSNCYYGIRVYDTCFDNTIQSNCIADNLGYGIYLGWGDRTSIWNNTFRNNNGAGSTYDSSHVQAYDPSSDNRWNSTIGYGNYWSDWTTPDVDPADGVVDQPYIIDGGSGAKDNYPLTTAPEPIPEFGVMPLVVMVFLAAILLTVEARRRKAS